MFLGIIPPGTLNTLDIRSFPGAFQENSEIIARSDVVTAVLLRVQVFFGCDAVSWSMCFPRFGINVVPSYSKEAKIQAQRLSKCR